MSHVNQDGCKIINEELFQVWSNETATLEETQVAIGLILNHLKMKIVRTNYTKHGNTELEIQEAD